MTTTVVNGCMIHYEQIGSGPPIVFTSGGRWGREYHRELAELMADHYQMTIYDRRNTGAADVVIGGADSEAELWAEDLAELIRQLGVAPVYIGEYAGGRTALVMTIRHPELVKALLIGWPAGGPVASERLGNNFYKEWIEAAEKGGMQAVVEASRFAEPVTQNPANRERLLAMNPQEFIRDVGRWLDCFVNKSVNLTLAGCLATDEEIASIRVPTVIVSGDDDVHTVSSAHRLHRLIPNSEHHDPPIPDEDWKKARGTPLAHTLQAKSSAPIFLDFLRRLEAK